MGANRELVERVLEAENRGDYEAAAALYAPDATYVEASGATTHGRTAIAELYRGFIEAFPDGRRRIERRRAGRTGAERGGDPYAGSPKIAVNMRATKQLWDQLGAFDAGARGRGPAHQPNRDDRGLVAL